MKLILSILCAAALSAFGTATAQTWPAKPIRLVVNFAPGGGTDIVARAMAPEFTKTLGRVASVGVQRFAAVGAAPLGGEHACHRVHVLERTTVQRLDRLGHAHVSASTTPKPVRSNRSRSASSRSGV